MESPEMDISAPSPLKVFLKNDLFSDVVLHVFKIDESGLERFKMDSLGDELDDDNCRKKRKICPLSEQKTTATNETQTDTCTLSSTPPPSLSLTQPYSSTSAGIEHEFFLKEMGQLPPTPIFSSLPGTLTITQSCTAPPTPPTVPSTPPESSSVPPSDIGSPMIITTTTNVPPPLPPCPSKAAACNPLTLTRPTSPRDCILGRPSSPTSNPFSNPCLEKASTGVDSAPSLPLPPSTISSTTSTSTTTSTTTTTSTSSTPTSTSTTIDTPTKSLSSTKNNSTSLSSSSTALTRSTSSSPKITPPKPTISLNAHRCVLAAHSKFFYVMFSNGMKESFEKEVKVYVEDVQSFERMFEYFYTGMIDYKNANLLSILELCIQFDVPRLCSEVCTFLGTSITLGNAFEILEFSRTRLEKGNLLYAKALEFALSNFFAIFRGFPPSIRYLSYMSLKELLQSDKLNVTMEFYAFMALRYWAEHTNAKECEIRELIPCIRFIQIDVDRLRNLVRPSKLGVVCPDMFKYYMTALEYHASAEDMRAMLCICEAWKRRRESYSRTSEFISLNWRFKWSGLTSWVYNWTHLQGYKLFATLGKHEDGTFGMYFVPSANEQKQFCLKAELKVNLMNEDGTPLCPELKLEPTIFKSDSKTPLNSIAKGWATKINPQLLVNDMIVMKIKARICE